jgi:hypothetical protein
MIQFKDEMNFYNDSSFNRQYNYIRDMSLAIYHNGLPVITAFQFAGDRYLLPFSFDGRAIQRFTPIKYNSGIFNKCSVLNGGSIWTVDMNGVVKKMNPKN